MAVNYVDVPSTRTATSDMRDKQFRIVKGASHASGNPGMALTSAATDILLGVNLDKPNSGEVGGVATKARGGICPVVYGGTVAVGDKLTSDANAAAIATTAAGNSVLGLAVKAGAAGDIGEVDLGSASDIPPA